MAVRMLVAAAKACLEQGNTPTRFVQAIPPEQVSTKP